MKKEDLTQYSEKKIKLVTTSGTFFTGHITQLNEDNCFFKDKFGKKLTISYVAIAYIVPFSNSDNNGGWQ